MSTEAFISKVKEGALRAWDKYKVLPSVVVAQAILESGWGKSELAIKGNNLFGVKASNWTGETVTINTKEFVNNLWTTVDARFRKYSSWSESVEDHGLFLSKERYKAAIGETDYKKAIQAIHKAGYATDPTYSDKVITIIERYKLYELDKEVINMAIITVNGRKPRVTSDAGHGMETAGKETPNLPQRNGQRMKENEFNEAVQAYLHAELVRCGIEHKDVAPGRTDIPLLTRAKASDAFGADLHISIHANAFNAILDDKAGGIETYYYGKDVTSKRVAEVIHRHLMQGTKMKDRGIKDGSKFIIINSPKAISILPELGFMDNKYDVEHLLSDSYRKECAVELAKACCEIFGIAYVPEVKPTSEINEIIKGVEEEMEQPLFIPTNNTLKRETIAYLEIMFKRGIINSREHIDKIESGTMTLSDLFGLGMTIQKRIEENK